MGLLADLEELGSAWKKCSWLGKLLIAGVIFFFTLAPLASLSDTVFKWKGFVLEALLFYREYVSSSIIYCLDYVGIKMPAFMIDLFVIQLLTASGLVRKNFAQERKHVAWRLIRLEAMIMVPLIIFASAYKEAIELSVTDEMVGSIVVIALILFFAPLLFSKGWSRSAYISYCGPVFLSLLVLGVTAAIQSGITRPM